MASLTAHLLEAGGHGRLRFHPDCPVCRRERLVGELSSEPVLSRRTQAVLASGVLAVSVAAPSAAFSQERDQASEGIAAPDQRGGGEALAPDFDPGGDTALPFDVGAPSGPEDGDASPESAPLEGEPVHDPDVPIVPPSEPGGKAPETDADLPGAGAGRPVPPAQGPPPGGPAQPGATPPPVEPVPPMHDQAPPSVEAPADEREASPPGPREPERRQEHQSNGGEKPGHRSAPDPRRIPPPLHPPALPLPSVPKTEPRQQPAVPPANPIEPATSEAVVAGPAIAAAGSPRRVGTGGGPNGRFHVVEPGESLWAIAKRLLGPDASAARIAREVARLWGLNEERIATGNPDLLLPGTKLRLR
jgi:LysM domain